jgi:hypothetical protein
MLLLYSSFLEGTLTASNNMFLLIHDKGTIIWICCDNIIKALTASTYALAPFNKTLTAF